MRKIILLVIIALAVANGYSQKKGGVRVGLDLGYVPTGGGGGGLQRVNERKQAGLEQWLAHP